MLCYADYFCGGITNVRGARNLTSALARVEFESAVDGPTHTVSEKAEQK
jgi:hypothetical protein